MRTRSIILLLILLAGLGLRLGWGLSRPVDHAYLSVLPDQLEYLQIAHSLLEGKGLAFFDPSVNEAVYAYRMPGYPAFVAMCGANVTVVRIVQAGIDTLSALAVFVMLRPVLPSRSDAMSLVAAGLVAFNPYLIYFSATILSETLFASLLIWGMALLIRTNHVAFVCGIGVMIASVYVRPGAIGLPVVMTLASQLVRHLPGNSRSFWRVPAGALSVGLLIVALLPWAFRNRYLPQVGAWVWTTTNGGITLYDGLNPQADGSSNQSGFRNWPELQSMTEVQRSEYFASLAKRFAMQHPDDALKLAGQKILRTWSPIPLSAEYGQNRLYVVAGLGFTLPLFVLTIIGLWYGRVSRSIKMYLLLPAIYFTLVHAVTVGSLRYRVPADVPMSLLASAGAAGWLARRHERVTA